MVFTLLTSLISTTSCFLYPAYASYKALSAPHYAPGADGDAQVERWLMYWAVVGSWTAVEAVLGWSFSWLPFYNIIKSLFFLYLSSSHTEGASYIYRTHLAPFFHEHEPDIDAFISSLRTRAGEAVIQGVGWVWEKVKTQLNIALPHEGQAHPDGPYPGQQYPTPGMHQPPTLQDPASGAVQQLYGTLARYAGTYMPIAVSAISAAAARASSSAVNSNSRTNYNQPFPPASIRSIPDRAEQVPESMDMPIPIPTPSARSGMGDPTLRSRTYQHASGSGSGSGSSSPNGSNSSTTAMAGVGFSSSLDRPPLAPSGTGTGSHDHRSSSESLASNRSGTGGKWAEMSYEQISRDEIDVMVHTQESRPEMGKRTSSGRWFGWGGGAASGSGGAGTGSNTPSRAKVD